MKAIEGNEDNIINLTLVVKKDQRNNDTPKCSFSPLCLMNDRKKEVEVEIKDHNISGKK